MMGQTGKRKRKDIPVYNIITWKRKKKREVHNAKPMAIGTSARKSETEKERGSTGLQEREGPIKLVVGTSMGRLSPIVYI